MNRKYLQCSRQGTKAIEDIVGVKRKVNPPEYSRDTRNSEIIDKDLVREMVESGP